MTNWFQLFLSNSAFAATARLRAAAAAAQGRAVQVDPVKPKLKAPGTKRFKLTYHGQLSDFAFKFNLRRFTKATGLRPVAMLACTTQSCNPKP